MMPAQYSGLAETIAQEYYWLKTTDIMLFFRHLAAGRFHVDYHGYVTPDVILDALRTQYIPYRNDIIHREEERKRKEQEAEDYERWKASGMPNAREHIANFFNEQKEEQQ